MSIGSEEIRLDLLVDMRSALADLKEFQDNAKSTAEVIQALSRTISANAKTWGMSFAEASVEWQKFNDTLSKGITGKGTGAGGAVIQQTEQYQKSLVDAGRATDDLTTKTENDTGRMARAYNPLITAIRVIVAMIVFDLVNAVRNTFTEMIQYADQYYNALYKIQVAQNILATSGIGIKQQDLIDIANTIEKTFGVFSDVEMKSAVANAALLTREFGFTKDQIQQVVEIAAALAIQTGDIKNLPSYIEQMTRALTTGTAPQIISKLGIDVKKASEEMKALEMQTYGTTTGLTDQQVAAVTLQVAYEHMSGEIKNFTSYQDTIAGSTDKLSKSWSDFIKDIGTIFAPAIAEWKSSLADFLESMAKGIEGAQEGWQKFAAVLAGVTAVIVELGRYGNIVGDAYAMLAGHLDVAATYANAYNTALQQMKTSQDAAASSANSLAPAIDLSKVSFDSIINSVVSMSEQMDKLARDYGQRVQDIIQQYANKISDAGTKYRQNEQNAEAKFQEAMRQLREKYLYDLEDALRNRDAKQVLRLQEQYNMQKETLTNNYKLEDTQRKQQYKNELAAAKQAENQQLAQAKQNYDNQQADLLQSWDDKLKIEAKKLADQLGLNSTGEKLIYDLLNNYYGPNGKMDGLYSYSLDSLSGFSADVLNQIAAIAADANNMLSSLPWGSSYSSGPGGKTTTHAPTTKGRGNWYTNSQGTSQTTPSPLYDSSGHRIWGNGQSAGADFVVPPGYPNDSYAMMVESGEHVSVTPALPRGRSGAYSSAMAGSSSDMNGTIAIEMTLSPDLEARVKKNTLDETARVITKIRNSK